MLESLMKLRGRFLQLHPGLEAVGGRRSPAHETVDLLLNVDNRLFHCSDKLCSRVLQSKLALAAVQLATV